MTLSAYMYEDADLYDMEDMDDDDANLDMENVEF